MARFFMKLNYLFSVPIAILFILNSAQIDKAYRITLIKKLQLGLRMFLNTLRVKTGTSFKAHLAMALKILETSPDVPGDILECGTWKGGCAANLSLVCKIVGRKLLIYDSFQGLPEGDPNDREAKYYQSGDYCGSFDEVRTTISKYGEIEVCQFTQGWFADTLPLLNSPILLAFVDVDLEASLDTCVRYIWPRLVDQGYIFIDECQGADYCALFYSEKYWQKHFDVKPPGLIGAGMGLALGEYYIGPWSERLAHPTWHAITGAFTRKDFSGYWSYYPDEHFELPISGQSMEAGLRDA